MLSVLLIDDEDLELDGLEAMIHAMDIGCTVCGKARNAMQGIDLALELKPDIILSDVKMPKMDGIEMAKKIKELGIKSFLVFISGYQDFAAAQQAIELGARSYLLKPVSRSSLYTILMQAIANVDESMVESQKKNEVNGRLQRLDFLDKNEFLNRILAKNNLSREEIAADAMRLGLTFQEGYFSVCLLDLQKKESAGIYENAAFRQHLEHAAGQFDAFPPVYMPAGEIAFLFNFPAIVDEDIINKHLYAACEYILTNTSYSAEHQLCMGVSGISSNIAYLPRLVRQAGNAIRQGRYNRVGGVFFYEEWAGGVGDLAGHMSRSLKEILSSIIEDDKEGLKQSMNALFARWDDTSSKEAMQAVCIEAIAAMVQMCRESGLAELAPEGREQILYTELLTQDTMLQTREFMIDYGYRLCDAFQEKKQDQSKQIVQEVERIIKNEFHTQLSLDSIADKVFLSPSYVNRVFKNHTGETIFDYLQSVRMAKALELLGQPQHRVYEVGTLVGYENPSYFSLVFKKCYGVTPKKYRERLNIYEK